MKAIFVGVNRYLDPAIPELGGARRDALALWALFTDTIEGLHKSQGSEYPAVVIRVLTQHYKMLKRNLLYTGVTRGKRLVVLVGQKKTVATAVRNASGGRRWSKLDEWLAGAQAGVDTGISREARSLPEQPLTDAMPYG